MRANTKQVKVDSVQGMELVISSYIAQGFQIAYRGEKITTMRKPKKFRVGLAVLLCILYVIPLIIYIIIYARKPDAEVVEIFVSSEETPDISYLPTTQTMISDTLESSTPQTMAQKALESPEKKTDTVVKLVFGLIGMGGLICLIMMIITRNTKNDSTTARIERKAETPSTTNQKIPAQKMIAAREYATMTLGERRKLDATMTIKERRELYVALISIQNERDGLTFKVYAEGLISDTFVLDDPMFSEYANRNMVRNITLLSLKDTLRALGFKTVKVTDGKAVYSYAVSDL